MTMKLTDQIDSLNCGVRAVLHNLSWELVSTIFLFSKKELTQRRVGTSFHVFSWGFWSGSATVWLEMNVDWPPSLSSLKWSISLTLFAILNKFPPFSVYIFFIAAQWSYTHTVRTSDVLPSVPIRHSGQIRWLVSV